jgi:hypothetical protein
MQNLTIKQVAISSVLVFGWTLAAKASIITTIPITTHCWSDQDALTMGITEVRTSSLLMLYGVTLDEIDVYLTHVGGTYLNGSCTIPADTAVSSISGKWTFPGGAAFLPYPDATRYLYNGADPISGWNPVGSPDSFLNFDAAGPSPATSCAGGRVGTTCYFAATSITGAWQSTYPALDLAAVDDTPGGDWGYDIYNNYWPTGYGFDNTLVGTFYVTPSTTAVLFGPTDAGTYGQWTFTYGDDSRTNYVTFVPEPATLVLLSAGLVCLLTVALRRRWSR